MKRTWRQTKTTQTGSKTLQHRSKRSGALCIARSMAKRSTARCLLPKHAVSIWSEQAGGGCRINSRFRAQS
jgi:hypothetical protein